MLLPYKTYECNYSLMSYIGTDRVVITNNKMVQTRHAHFRPPVFFPHDCWGQGESMGTVLSLHPKIHRSIPAHGSPFVIVEVLSHSPKIAMWSRAN